MLFTSAEVLLLYGFALERQWLWLGATIVAGTAAVLGLEWIFRWERMRQADCFARAGSPLVRLSGSPTRDDQSGFMVLQRFLNALAALAAVSITVATVWDVVGHFAEHRTITTETTEALANMCMALGFIMVYLGMPLATGGRVGVDICEHGILIRLPAAQNVLFHSWNNITGYYWRQRGESSALHLRINVDRKGRPIAIPQLESYALGVLDAEALQSAEQQLRKHVSRHPERAVESHHGEAQ